MRPNALTAQEMGVGSWGWHRSSLISRPMPLDSLLQFGQQLASPADDRPWDAGQLGDVDAIGAVGPAAPQLVQKHHAAILLDRGHVVVLDARQDVLQLGQLVVVGGEQRSAAEPRLVVQVLDHRARDRHAVVGARAAPDLVQNNQAAASALHQQRGRLGHLDHERALAGGDVVLCADAREDPVDQADLGRVGRNE